MSEKIATPLPLTTILRTASTEPVRTHIGRLPGLFPIASGILFGFVDGEQDVGFLYQVDQAEPSALTQWMMAGQGR